MGLPWYFAMFWIQTVLGTQPAAPGHGWRVIQSQIEWHYLIPLVLATVIGARLFRRFILSPKRIAVFTMIVISPLIGAVIAGLCLPFCAIAIDLLRRPFSPAGASFTWIESFRNLIECLILYPIAGLGQVSLQYYIAFPLSAITVFALRKVSGLPAIPPRSYQ